MASHATIVSSTIPQLPKESILDGSNYLDWELQIKTLLQYHLVWNVINGSEKKPPVTSSASNKSVVGSSNVEIEAWLDKDSSAHAFLVFNINRALLVKFKIQMKRQPMNYGQPSKTSSIELIMLK